MLLENTLVVTSVFSNTFVCLPGLEPYRFSTRCRNFAARKITGNGFESCDGCYCILQLPRTNVKNWQEMPVFYVLCACQDSNPERLGRNQE